MYANGFFEQQRRSPVSLAAVIGLHAAALGAVILYGSTTFQREEENRLIAINVKQPEPPPPDPPPPPQPQARPEQQQSRLDTPAEQPVINLGPTVAGPPTPPQPPIGAGGREPVQLANATPVIPPPVRRAAEVDPRFRDALQPPYPPDRERAQQAGRVRVRITIGTDGRVTGIEQISASHEAFWRVTQRQALNRWRFRPATENGRPVVSTMTMNVTFRIPDA